MGSQHSTFTDLIETSLFLEDQKEAVLDLQKDPEFVKHVSEHLHTKEVNLDSALAAFRQDSSSMMLPIFQKFGMFCLMVSNWRLLA